jgi:radical SAM protein with 4Fe4S-binding SPASM domain
MIGGFDKIVADLQSLYDTTGPYYLSDFYQPGGDKNLYEFLKLSYHLEYKNNFRILIVQDREDIYEYQDLPGAAICALQKYASQIDISNFFILIITGNKGIALELEQAQRLYSNDACSIQSHIVKDIDYTSSYMNRQDTFCVLPWMHLYVGTDGNVLPCCQADHQFPMGNITKQHIDDIMLSDGFNKLRKDLLEGNRRKECRRCYEQEDAGLVSARINHNQQWNNIKSNDLNSDGSVVKFNPLYLDIRLSNLCNLKCRMCSGYFSSAIAQEEAEIFGNKTTVESSLRLQSRKSNLAQILNYVSGIEKIYFAGGEPLLSYEHYEILDALIACNNTDLEIVYNTNFTILTYRDRDVLDIWKCFKNVSVAASLDAEYEVAEYVRHGTKWDTIESNLEIVKSYCPHVNFTVTSTVGLLNVASLIDLQKRWHEIKKLDISKFSLNVMISPDHLTLCSLPEKHKKRLDDLINDHIIWCESNGARRLVNQWKDVLSYMWSRDSSYNLGEFQRLIRIMDTHRKESLIDVLPEYKDLI